MIIHNSDQLHKNLIAKLTNYMELKNNWELKHKHFTSIATKYKFIYIQVSLHVSADVGHPQVNTTQGSQYLQVTTSVYMEAHSSKTLKH
jgi:hypothetical protein